MTLILGFTLGHDGTVAAVKDGRLVAAIARERLTRRKKEAGIGREEIDYVLDLAEARLEEVTAIAFGVPGGSTDGFVRLLEQDGREIRGELAEHPPGTAALELQASLGGHRVPATFVQHQLCHCAAAYYTSPFPRAAAFSVDSNSRRPQACSLFAKGDGLRLTPLSCPGVMIGNAYNEFTRRLGLGEGLYKAGTTMGLASYGQPAERALDTWRDYALPVYEQPDPDGLADRMWAELSGLPAQAAFSPADSDSRQAMGVAASLQYVFEEVLVQQADALYSRTANSNGGNLCLGGGSMLNCNANSAILRRTPFSQLHLFPGCGDDGTAVGAALWLAHHVHGLPRPDYRPEELAYLGRPYADPAIGQPLDLDSVADALAAGKVVGWFQGRSEFGPRALGNRSILADPRDGAMRDHINQRIKRREWFRPFAPMVMAERMEAWFEFDRPSPFMLFTARVRQPEKVPAITHVDGTARLQTVTEDSNPLIHDLLGRFEARTGVPILLNTSMNVNGEPLVESPADALRFWESTPVDLLVVGGRMMVRG